MAPDEDIVPEAVDGSMRADDALVRGDVSYKHHEAIIPDEGATATPHRPSKDSLLAPGHGPAISAPASPGPEGHDDPGAKTPRVRVVPLGAKTDEMYWYVPVPVHYWYVPVHF
jgi:hypothetical protein